MPDLNIELKDIVQEYPAPSGEGVVRIVDGVNLTFDKPAINMLLGPSGCGKSTILKMMGGVRPDGVATPTSGQVIVDGQVCADAHNDAVMVFQQYANFPWLTVRQNIEFPFRLDLWRGTVPDEEIKRRVDHILEVVDLADRQHNRPAQLSGGQNQRLALAQALVLQPRILLMDEPFGALDAQTRAEMQELLVKLWEEQQCTIVFVTHDITEALLLGDRIIVLTTRPATVAKEFHLPDARPRNDLWLRSTRIQEMEDEILNLLNH